MRKKREVNTKAKSGEDKNRTPEDKGEKGRTLKRVAWVPSPAGSGLLEQPTLSLSLSTPSAVIDTSAGQKTTKKLLLV